MTHAQKNHIGFLMDRISRSDGPDKADYQNRLNLYLAEKNISLPPGIAAIEKPPPIVDKTVDKVEKSTNINVTECLNCGQSLAGMSARAKYCSNRCKTQKQRSKK